MNQRSVVIGLGAALLSTTLAGCFVSDGRRSSGDRTRVVDDEPTYLATYEPCAFSDECLPEDACYEITVDYGDRVVTDGMCTAGCGSDADCPLGSTGEPGACYDIGLGFLCYERCFDDFDCPALFGCLDTVGGVSGDAICLPI